MRRAVAIAAAAALLALAPAVEAHVGSPDAVQDGQAGPYHLLVTIRPPEVIPGIAQIEIRALGRRRGAGLGRAVAAARTGGELAAGGRPGAPEA